MENISYKEASTCCGYLDKKSPSLFGGWQRRYFKVLEGKVITYSDKENDKEYKGTISISKISDLRSVDKTGYRFILTLDLSLNLQKECGN